LVYEITVSPGAQGKNFVSSFLPFSTASALRGHSGCCNECPLSGGKADIGFMSPSAGERIKNGWDNFKNTQWDSMGLRDKVGQDKYLKLQF